MDRVVLALRLQTLDTFLNKIENTKNEEERMVFALEASEISDKIMKLTPNDILSSYEHETLCSKLDFFSLAVFVDNTIWARECLNSIKNSSISYF